MVTFSEFSFTVSQENIDDGIPGDAELCPVAYCMKGDGIPYVEVGPSWVDFTDPITGNTYVQVPMPDILQDFVHDFDAGYDVEPMAFTLKVSEEMRAAL